MNVKKAILIRVRTVFLLVAIFALGIAYRIFHIQFIDGEYWRSKRSTFALREIPATRGNIYAADGSLLATSIPIYRVGFDPRVSQNPLDKKQECKKLFEKHIDTLCLLLSQKFKNRTAQDYKHLIMDAKKQKKSFVYLVPGFTVSYREQQEMKQWPLIKEGQNKSGVVFEKIYKRYHPFKELAFRTVGFVNASNFGAGIESSFNPMLAGYNGRATFQKLGGGLWRPLFDGSEIRPVDGQDIYTTLDINIQDVAEASLLNAVTTSGAKFGCVVVMEVATGHVKAMANLGLEGDKYIEKYNYAVGLKHYPGSTFKLASYMAMMEDRKLKPTDTVKTGNGRLRVDKQWILEAKEHAYGTLSIKEAFAKSSNVAVAKLTLETFRRRPEKYLEYITNFGLAEPLNFQIRGAERPFFRSPSDKRHWNDAALAKMSYGYESQITPLQTLAFYNAVANNGKMVQPIIVREIRSNDKVIQSFTANVIREKICSEKTLAYLKELLVATVANPKGTAHRIHTELYSIAGKTGTAHKFEDGRWVENAYYTSFAGFFPADKPKYSAIIIIDSPKGGQMAGEAAAPVFRDIADKIYANDVEMHRVLVQDQKAKDLPKIAGGRYGELQEVCNKLNISNFIKDSTAAEWVKVKTANQAIYWKSNESEVGRVPDVEGMSLKDAIYRIENGGYKIRTVGRGKVIGQTPRPNVSLEPGKTIIVTLG